MFKKHKKNWLMLAVALGSILVSSIFGSLIQSKGGSIKVSDLRDETNTGAYYNAAGQEVEGVTIKGSVKSGILYMPKDASEDNKKPAIVLTHGYLNNRELQLPNAYSPIFINDFENTIFSRDPHLLNASCSIVRIVSGIITSENTPSENASLPIISTVWPSNSEGITNLDTLPLHDRIFATSTTFSSSS